jgi:hypothetical protein
MKKIIFFLFITFCSLTYAQEAGTIRGKILDGELFNEPLLMAAVSLNNTEQATHTNFNGNFEFNGITPGSYQLVVQFLGYEAIELPVNIKAGERVELLETLHAKMLPLPSTAEMITAENESEYTSSKSSQKR